MNTPEPTHEQREAAKKLLDSLFGTTGVYDESNTTLIAQFLAARDAEKDLVIAELRTAHRAMKFAADGWCKRTEQAEAALAAMTKEKDDGEVTYCGIKLSSAALLKLLTEAQADIAAMTKERDEAIAHDEATFEALKDSQREQVKAFGQKKVLFKTASYLIEKYYAVLDELTALKTREKALEAVVEAAKGVDDNDGVDEGWKLRYAVRNLAALDSQAQTNGGRP